MGLDHRLGPWRGKFFLGKTTCIHRGQYLKRAHPASGPCSLFAALALGEEEGGAEAEAAEEEEALPKEKKKKSSKKAAAVDDSLFEGLGEDGGEGEGGRRPGRVGGPSCFWGGAGSLAVQAAVSCAAPNMCLGMKRWGFDKTARRDLYIYVCAGVGVDADLAA